MLKMTEEDQSEFRRFTRINLLGDHISWAQIIHKIFAKHEFIKLNTSNLKPLNHISDETSGSLTRTQRNIIGGETSL